MHALALLFASALATTLDGPAYAEQYIVIVGTSADPRPLRVVAERFAPETMVALWSSDFARLSPCKHLVVAGAYVDEASAATQVRELLANRIEAYVRFTGAWVGDRPSKQECVSQESPEGWIVSEGAIALGAREPAPPWADELRRPLDVNVVQDLHVGDRVRVGPRICTVEGFDLVRFCTTRTTVEARLGPLGCGDGGAIAQPVGSPVAEVYAPGPLSAGPLPGLDRGLPAATVRSRDLRQTWTGGAGRVVHEITDRWTREESDDCGGWLWERSSSTVLQGGPTLLGSTSADVLGVFDLDRDGRPEVLTGGLYEPTVLWRDGQRVIALDPVCTCGC